jgi:hypothetical protein
MAGDIVVGDFDKSQGEVVRVSLTEFKGRNYVGVRVWYTDSEDELKPSKKGINLELDLFPRLANLIEKSKEIVLEKGMLDAEDFEIEDEEDEEEEEEEKKE